MAQAYLKGWIRETEFTGKEEAMMTREEAQGRAARLGLSTWVVQAVAVGPKSRTVDVMCIGFASVEVPIAEAETWEEAFEEVTRIIFTN
jgi:hypothetical protein